MANPFDEADANPFDAPSETALRAPAPVADADIRTKKIIEPHDMLGAGAIGIADGATGNFDDELLGALNTADAAPGENSTGEKYAEMRDAVRADQATAAKEHPVPYYGGQVLGSLMLPAGKLTKGAGWLANAGRTALTGLGTGLLQGAGASTADTAGGVAKDAAVSGGIGALASGALGAAAHPFAKYFNSMKSAAVATAAEMEQILAAKAAKSAGSGLGGETTAGLTAIKNMRDIAANEGLPAEMRAAAQAKADSETARILEAKAAQNAIDAFDGRAGSIDSANVRLAEAQKLGRPEALQAATDARLAKPEMMPRLKSIGKDWALTGLGMGAGYLGGHMLGHDVLGTMGGASVGTLAHSLTSPARRLGNAVRSPGFRSDLGGFGAAVAEHAPMVSPVVGASPQPRSSLSDYIRFLEDSKESQ